MDFAFSEEQELFRATLRRFLEERSPPALVRRAMDSSYGFDPALWKEMARVLGLQGLHLPEAYGGQEFGFLELGIVQEELGRTPAPVPYFSTVCLAATAILHAGSEGDGRALLPGIAAGQTTAALGLSGSLGQLGCTGHCS